MNQTTAHLTNACPDCGSHRLTIWDEGHSPFNRGGINCDCGYKLDCGKTLGTSPIARITEMWDAHCKLRRESKTPRTDAAERVPNTSWQQQVDKYRNLARQLETELAQMKQERDKWRDMTEMALEALKSELHTESQWQRHHALLKQFNTLN
jgi:hypothetical protein